MHLAFFTSDLSRRPTTHEQAAHLAQLPLGANLGSRSWVHRNLTLRVAESRADTALVSEIILQRHYLRRRATPPRVLVLSYLGSLGGTEAAAMVQVALLPANHKPLLQALDLHPCSVLSLTRLWRADDLGPEVAPDLTPYVLRQVVRRVAADWTERKCTNLAARPRMLLTGADPGVGHDGATYLSAGAVALGPGKSGRLAFAWPLDQTMRAPLRAYAARARA